MSNPELNEAFSDIEKQVALIKNQPHPSELPAVARAALEHELRRIQRDLDVESIALLRAQEAVDAHTQAVRRMRREMFELEDLLANR